MSATPRSSPGGLGIAVSSKRRSTASDTGRSYGRALACRDGLAGPRPRAVERRADEAAEERSRPRRPGLELRVELARDEPGMVRELDDLHETALLEGPAHDEAGVDEPVAERVVDLVAVPVPLVDRVVAVELAGVRTLLDLDRLRPELHGAAEILDALLLR